ncbi:hypothetical protein MJG53_018858, partial [Ovis ammon polii x Ovis aries]
YDSITCITIFSHKQDMKKKEFSNLLPKRLLHMRKETCLCEMTIRIPYDDKVDKVSSSTVLEDTYISDMVSCPKYQNITKSFQLINERVSCLVPNNSTTIYTYLLQVISGKRLTAGCSVKDDESKAGLMIVTLYYGTRVQSTVQEDPICRAACVPQLLSQRYGARGPQLLGPHDTATEALTSRDWTPDQEKPPQ